MIHHVALEVRDVDTEAELRFWALLGFEQIDPPETLRGTTAWAQRGDQQIHLLLSDDPIVPPQGHVAVVAPDYEATLAELRREGHEVDERPQHWGSPRAFARTPAGHRVELMLFPPR